MVVMPRAEGACACVRVPAAECGMCWRNQRRQQAQQGQELLMLVLLMLLLWPGCTRGHARARARVRTRACSNPNSPPCRVHTLTLMGASAPGGLTRQHQ